jgi:diguanylate cyclase
MHKGTGDVAADTGPAQSGAQDQSQRELWLPAKRQFLAQLADFLIDHDLEILPFTLSIAYDCVTGGSPNLAQQILERAGKGLPIALRWLEDVHCAQPRDATAEAIATLVGQLESSMSDLGRTMAGVRDATGTYSIALESHVADLQSVGEYASVSGGDLIARLTSLTRLMLNHTRTVESEMVQSEALIGVLQDRLDEARHLANQDHLTGLPNRRAFDELYDREVREAKLAGETLCVAFCDIDHFKRVNDTHGHPAGDRVIRYVAETLGRIADARCHVARHGGEEFAILLRGASLVEGWTRLDAAREEIAQKRLVNRANDIPFGRITFSGGIADALAFGSKREALKAADEALYAAKDSGRNRILIAGDLPQPLREIA